VLVERFIKDYQRFIFVFLNELLEVQSGTYIKCSNGTKKSKKQREKTNFFKRRDVTVCW